MARASQLHSWVFSKRAWRLTVAICLTWNFALAAGDDPQRNTASEPAPLWRETHVFGGLELRHADLINFIQITPDGKRIVTTSYDAYCRVWDAETGTLIREIDVSHPICSALLVDGGDAVLVSINDEKFVSCIERWSLKTGAREWRTRPQTERIDRLKLFGTTGTHAYASAGAWLYCLETGTGAYTAQTELPDKWNDLTVLAPDGSRIAVCSRSHRLMLNASDLSLKWSAEQDDHAYCLVFSADCKKLYAFYSKSVEIRNAIDGAITGFQPRALADLRNVTFLPGGMYALALRRTAVVEWDLRTNTVEPLLKTDASIFTLAPDASWVAANFNNMVQRWDLQTKTLRPGPTGHWAPVYDVVGSDDGKRIASCCGIPAGGLTNSPDRLRVWNRYSGAELWSLDTKCDDMAAVRFSSDGSILYAVGSRYNKVRKETVICVFALNAESGREIYLTELSHGEDYSRGTALELSETGSELIVSGVCRLYFCDAKTGRELRSVPIGDWVKTFALLDHDRLAVTGDGGYWTELPGNLRLRMYDAASGNLRNLLPSLDLDNYTCTWKVQATPDRRGFIAAICAGSWLPDSLTGENANLAIFRMPDFSGTPDRPSVQTAVQKLNDDNVDVRDDATRALIALTPAAKQLVSAARAQAEPEARDRIGTVLAAYAERELPQLQQALDVGGHACAVDISPDGMEFVVAVEDTNSGLSRLYTGQMPKMNNGQTMLGQITSRQFARRNPQTLRFLPDGQSFIAGNNDGTLSLFERIPEEKAEPNRQSARNSSP